MFVAPAGYGKTTLAQQWLQQKPHVWYRATAASADVAALATGLARAAKGAHLPHATEAVDRLRATSFPDDEASALARLFVSDTSGWPRATWLVIDDYQFIKGTAAEDFVAALVESGSVQILVSSRVRPNWVTPRKLLYGEIYELSATRLAMDEAEAAAVLGDDGAATAGLLAVADGWPALIGLAALAGRPLSLEDDIPPALYDYFADELLGSLPSRVETGLIRLSMLDTVERDIATIVLGPDGDAIVDSGVCSGLLTPSGRSTWHFHPLFRAFLQKKLHEAVGGDCVTIIEQVVRRLIEYEDWDQAYNIIRIFQSRALLDELIHSAMTPMLSTGRVSTFERWIKAASRDGHSSSIIELAQAEIALRHGRHRTAGRLALRAAQHADTDNAIRSQAHVAAGRAAYLGDDRATALHHFRVAHELADTADVRRRALWGQVLAAHHFDATAEEEASRRLVAHPPKNIDEFFQLEKLHWLNEALDGDLLYGFERLSSLLPLLSRVKDPLVRTSFLNSLGRTAALTGRYREAAKLARDEILEAEKWQLAFVFPPAYLTAALAALGLGRFSEAKKWLQRTLVAAQEIDDLHNQAEAEAAESRLYLSLRQFGRACGMGWPRGKRQPSPAMQAERLTSHALALAATGDVANARAALTEAASLGVGVEARNLAAWANAVIDLRAGDDPLPATGDALEIAHRSGCYDVFVVVCRAFPDLFDRMLDDNGLRSEALRAVDQVPAARLRRSAAARPEPPKQRRAQLLTQRESEVFNLLATGLTNREIAQALFISEVTVKVHVRRILEKLGVRSRTEAAILAANYSLREA